MTDRRFVDTNILVYVFDGRDARKQHLARLVMGTEPSRIVLSTQVLGEFYVTARRKLPQPLTAAEASAAVTLYARLSPVPITADLAQRAVRTSESEQLSYWDALIVEAAVAGGCQQIYTEDLTARQVIRGVEIVNPFA